MLGPKLNVGADEVVVEAAVVEGAAVVDAAAAAQMRGLAVAAEDGAAPSPEKSGLLGSELVAGVEDD